MANPWFRMYSEFAHDPKVQRLSESNQRRYIMLLCIRCSNGDVTLHDSDVTFSLRISDEEWIATKDIFVERGLIDKDNKPTAWGKRQYVSDSSAPRVAKHRAGKKLDSNGDVTLQKPQSNAIDTDTDTDTDTEDKTNVIGKPIDSCPHQEIISLYHEILTTMPSVKMWTPKRQKLLQARWREEPKRQSIEFWRKFFVFVSQSDFLCGKTEKPFICNLEWLLNSSNFVKVIEGNYANS